MLRVKQWYVGYVLNEMRITQSSRIGYAPILLIFNRSLQKQRAKKADQRISPRRALKAIIANLPPVSVFEIHAAHQPPAESYTSFHTISAMLSVMVAIFSKKMNFFGLQNDNFNITSYIASVCTTHKVSIADHMVISE